MGGIKSLFDTPDPPPVPKIQPPTTPKPDTERIARETAARRARLRGASTLRIDQPQQPGSGLSIG